MRSFLGEVAAMRHDQTTSASVEACGGASGGKLMTRRSFLVFGGVAALGLIVCRIGIVNANAETIPTEHYSLGEWVDLTGCYFNELSSEDMAGYSLRVVSAEAMNASEYIARYGVDSSALENVEVKNASIGPDADVVVLEYETRNDSNDEGGIALYYERLIPARKNVAYSYDEQLWLSAEPQMKSGFPGGFGLVKGTSFTTHVPFCYVSNPGYLEKYDRQLRMPVCADRDFELILCNAPTRKIVRVSL